MKIQYKIFFTIWIVYLFFISGYGGTYLSESIIHEAMSVVDKGTFVVNDYIKEPCKITGCDYSHYKGNFYSGFAPGNSFLVIPLYAIFKPLLNIIPNFLGVSQIQFNTIFISIISTIFLISLLSALLSVLLYNFLGNIVKNKKKRLLVVFTFAFGTLFFVYSTGFYPRILSAFFLFTSFLLLYKSKKEKISIFLFLSGFLGGYAVTIDFPQIISLFLLFIYLLTFRRDKKIIYFILGAAIPLFLLSLYNFSIYDSITPSSYEYRAKTLTELMSTNLEGLTFHFPSINTMLNYLFSLKSGIFIYMPILFLAFYGFYLGFKENKYKKELCLFLLIFISQLLFYSSFSGRSPCSFGLRYLVPTLPFIIIPLIFAFKKISFKIILLFSFISIFLNFLGVMYYFGCILEGIIYYITSIPKIMLTNYTLSLISLKFYNLNWKVTSLIILILLTITSIMIYFTCRNRK